MGLPPAQAQRTALVWRLVLGLLGLLTLVVSLPLSAFANEHISAWHTETIPQATAPAPIVQGAAAAPPRQLNVFERQAAETIKITNEFRRRNGLPAFEEDPVCSQAAFDHAQDMARRSYFDHFGPDGSSPTTRYQHRNTAGQRVIRITENIARGNGTTPESALRMWLELPGSPQTPGRHGNEPHRRRRRQRLVLLWTLHLLRPMLLALALTTTQANHLLPRMRFYCRAPTSRCWRPDNSRNGS